MKFDWDRFLDKSNNIAVLCSTLEEAKDFCKEMDNHGLTWCGGSSYLRRTNFEKDNGCYSEGICYSNHGEYCYKSFYKREGFEIWKYSDFKREYHWYNDMIY